jgi:hypothetical protein
VVRSTLALPTTAMKDCFAMFAPAVSDADAACGGMGNRANYIGSQL